MRSYTESGAPGRCPRCWVKLEHCICAAMPTVAPRTALIGVRHLRESYKSTGTLRIAALAVPSLSLLEFSDDPEPTEKALVKHDLSGAWLLFPGDETAPARVPAPGEVKTLVLLDGTWRQTRKMVKKLPSLLALPRLALPEKAAPPVRLRESPSEDSRSTLEALADALELLEGAGAELTALHARYVEAVFRARGVWDLKRD